MTKRAWVTRSWEGGWSTDPKIGIKNSFTYSQSLDFRKQPSQLTVLGQPTREDNGVVKDLVQNEVMVFDGSTYSMGSNGFVYHRTVPGVWSEFGKVQNGYFGMDYRQDTDSVYLCSAKTVSLINPVSKVPVLQTDYYNISMSTYNNTANAGFNVNTYQAASNQTTIIGITFVESTEQSRFFQLDIEPLNKIDPFIVKKGTGDWTLTLHDGLDNVLGTVTITNANLVNGQFNDFVFSSAVRLQIAATNTQSSTTSLGAQTYHFHLTSTVADGTVSSSGLNDLSTADLELWADRLVNSPNGMHPMVSFQQFECIGNERYLSAWEPLGDPTPDNAEWQRHRLVFPTGYQVCGLENFNEYIAIACERISTNVNTFQDGIIFFWDGLSSTYNYFIKIPEGSPYAIRQHKNVLYYYAGGSWYAISSPDSVPVKVRTMPGSQNEYTSTTSQAVVYPYASTIRKGILLMGYPSTTTNTTTQFGVYSWGSVDKNNPESFGYNYILSTGDQTYTPSNNLTIGMVQNFGDLLHVSWQDNGVYGVDVVNNASLPASHTVWESMIFDNNYVGKQKEAAFMEATWLPLPSGVTVVLKYQVNRGSWIYSNGATTATPIGGFTNSNTWLDGDGYARFDIGENGIPARFNEIQLGIDVYCDGTVTSTPIVTSVSMIFDDMNSEALE